MATLTAARASYWQGQFKASYGRGNQQYAVYTHGTSLRSDFISSIPAVRDVLIRPTFQTSSASRLRREHLVTCTLNTNISPSEGDGARPRLGTTRLGRIIQERRRDFVSKFNKGRKNFPTKIFLLLLGYYSANALATVLGQTGDWDVLAAGILVAIIESIGYLMYRMPSVLGERSKELLVFVNFYKSGFSFGLFVDAFKLGS